MAESIVEELRTLLSVINGKLEIERGKGGGIPVSWAVAEALMVLGLRNGTHITVHLCIDGGEKDLVWYEVSEKDLLSLGGLALDYFEICGI